MIRIITFFLIIVWSYTAVGASDLHRGMWVVRYALSTPDEAERIIETARQLQITDLYIQVRALGQVYYPTQTQQVIASGYNRSSLNTLQLLIEKARAEHMKVHAWINAFYIWSGDQPPSQENHIFNTAGQHLLRTANSMTYPAYKNLKQEGIEGYFVDPDDPQNYYQIKELISELIRDYNVDGIHLDYFRYPQMEYSFSTLNRTKFWQYFFVDPASVFGETETYINRKGVESFRFINEKYKEFLRNNLTALLSDLRHHIKFNNDKVVLSVAVKPDPGRARDYYLQNWPQWLSKRYCDRVLLMNYQTDLQQFKDHLDEAGILNMPQKIIVGVSTYNQDGQAVTKRLNIIRQSEFAGYALFSYNYLRDHKVMLSHLHSDLAGID